MSYHMWALIGLLVVLLWALAEPLGVYLARVAEGRPTDRRFLGRLELALYRVCGVNSATEMSWNRYALAILLFNFLGALVLYGIQRVQASLPLNPQGLVNISPDSAFNTAVSFSSNTNWQGYAGELTMSTFTQMVGLTVQNFLSAATGIAVAFALIRGFARHAHSTIGNAWVDITRVTLYVLFPLSLLYSVFLVSQGVVQSFESSVTAQVLDSPRHKESAVVDPRRSVESDPPITTPSHQVIPMGPVASQEAIKMIGTNGGGYFNANSSHPFENPTPLTNFVQMLVIFLIPAALCMTLGSIIGDKRQGRAILATMTILFVLVTVVAVHHESQKAPELLNMGIDGSMGNMEGKELRFGVADSTVFASVTTLASCGAVNSMHDSFTPMGGFITFFNMMLGEVVFGGVGSGLYGMLVFAITAVFLCGLMIGRTPEYLGKRIESFEMKMVSVAILVTPLIVLAGTAIAVSCADGLTGVANPGAHGFSEILYAFTSAGNNNGSAFAGLSANTPFYNFALGVAMWIGRFGVIVPILALAGGLASKKRVAPNAGTMPTHGPLFVMLLASTVILVGALNYLPALALGPVAEHLTFTSPK